MRTTTKARLDNLDEKLDAFLTELEQYSHDDLNKSAANGGWSVMQCLYHLLGAEQGSLNYVKKKLSYDPELPKGGLISRCRAMALWTFMRLPIKFKAPAYIATDKLPPVSDFTETAALYRASRKELRKFLEELDPKWNDRLVFRHLIAGRLDVNQMLSFFNSHFVRHQKQARKALKA